MKESSTMTARARIAIAGLALIAIACTFSGCGCSLCSRSEFLNTAFGEDHRERARSAAMVTTDDATQTQRGA
jgi:hypothetical protein